MNINNIVYRKATEDDLDEIKVLAGEVVIKNYSSFLGDEAKCFVESGASDTEIDDNLTFMTVACYQGEIVAIVVLKEDLLHLIMVKHSCQGRGIGGRLLDYAENELFSRYDTIWLETFDKNAPTINFYQKHGWNEVDRTYNDFLSGYTLRFEKQRRMKA